MARRSVAITLGVLCLVSLTAFLSLSLIFQDSVNVQRLLAASPPNQQDRDHAAVQGDYLLGVGKADITGERSVQSSDVHMLILTGRWWRST